MQTATLTLANISWLLAALAFVVAPQLPRLPIWMIAACVAATGWRWWIARRGLRLPQNWLVVLFALGAAAATFISYRRVSVRDAWITLLIILLCLKILEMRTKRDALLSIFLGFIIVLTNFLYSQTMLIGVYMLVCVWLLVATLVGFNRVNTNATIKQRLGPAAWLLLQAIPLMLVVFFLFPRTSGPLWALPQSNAASSGLSDSMSPGDISRLILNDSPAFRVDFDAAIPQSFQLYWRGPVLSQFDGKRWSMSFTPLLEQLRYEPLSLPVSYRVTLQPTHNMWLFGLDLPAGAVKDSYFTRDFQMRARRPIAGLMAYALQSHLSYRIDPDLSPDQLQQFLRYPTRNNPRTIALGQQLRTENPDSITLIEKLLAMYNKDFEYTLEPPALGIDAMDEFLFETRKGFCEHYAGSFALVMRAAGIPARVVTGYQGGEVNPLTKQLVVRQSDAHAWTEVWLPERGWVRIDPTSAVSPLRINQGIDAALGPQGIFNNLIAADKLGILQEMRFAWDAVNSQWNRWVVGFNADKQQDLLSRLGMKTVDWQNIALWMLISVFTIGAIGSALLLAKLYMVREPPIVRTYNRLCTKLAKHGWDRAPAEGPADFLQRIAKGNPTLAKRVAPIIERYIVLRYHALSQQATSTTWQTKFQEFRLLVARF